MRQVTHWPENVESIQFAVDQLKKYGVEPIIRTQPRTGKVALFRADMKGEGSVTKFTEVIG